jgi:hypothetical protein
MIYGLGILVGTRDQVDWDINGLPGWPCNKSDAAIGVPTAKA